MRDLRDNLRRQPGKGKQVRPPLYLLHRILRPSALKMPGPGARNAKKRKPPTPASRAQASNSPSTAAIPENFFADIDNGATWQATVDHLCEYFELPGKSSLLPREVWRCSGGGGEMSVKSFERVGILTERRFFAYPHWATAFVHSDTLERGISHVPG